MAAAPEVLGPILLNVAALAAVAVAVALLALNARHRPTRVFAYILLLGGGATMINYGFRAIGGVVANQGALAAPYFYIPGPLLVLYFAHLYPRPRGWLGRSRWGGWAVLGLALALDGLYALDHRLWTQGPLVITRQVEPLVYASVGLVLTRDYLRGQHGVVPGALLLMIAGFTLDTGYSATRGLLQMSGGVLPVSPTRVLWSLALVPMAAMVALLLRRLGRAQDPAEVRALRRTVGLVAVGLLSALVAVVAQPAWAALGYNIAGVPAALVSIAGTTVIAYALLRHRLFDIDLRAQKTIRAGTVVGSFALVLFVGSEAARAVLPSEASLLVGVLGAGVLLAGIRPLQRAAERVAKGALPDATDSSTFLNLRKLDVYRAALEQAADPAGGAPSPTDPALARLRRELGLTERDHAVLALALVHRGATPVADLPLQPGERLLNRYVVERALGAGAHGATYLAEDTQGKERVVLKSVRAAGPGAAREARAMRELRHPNVVGFRELALEGPQPYVVMEYVDGGDLRDRLARGPLERVPFLRLARDLLGALEAVHAKGLVHRDVKPSNILLARDGSAKLSDFGVASLPGMETTAGAGSSGSAVGTVRYMSPEAARGRRVTPRSDLYSAAATLYEAWTGKPHLEAGPGESAVELQMRAAAGAPFRGAVRGPKALRDWFARGLHPEPSKRFPSAQAMRAALEEALAKEAPDAR